MRKRSNLRIRIDSHETPIMVFRIEIEKVAGIRLVQTG